MTFLRACVVVVPLVVGPLAWCQQAGQEAGKTQGLVQEKPLVEKPTVQAAPRVLEKLEAVTFADAKGKVFLDLHEVASVFMLDLEYDDATKHTTMGGVEVDRSKLRRLFDGSSLIEAEDLGKFGVVYAEGADGESKVSDGATSLPVVVPSKTVEVSVSRQSLRAWQGDRLVMKTHVSTGRTGHESPLGDFKAGGKFLLKLSTLYDDAEMPFAVQVIGDVFVHGYASVPHNPASHGCIRMPLKPDNAAKYFYNWVEAGVPVSILKDWSKAAQERIKSEPGGEDELATPGHVKNIKSGSPYGVRKPKPGPAKPKLPVFGPPLPRTSRAGGKSGG